LLGRMAGRSWNHWRRGLFLYPSEQEQQQQQHSPSLWHARHVTWPPICLCEEHNTSDTSCSLSTFPLVVHLPLFVAAGVATHNIV
jgi:hypothetical protein